MSDWVAIIEQKVEKLLRSRSVRERIDQIVLEFLKTVDEAYCDEVNPGLVSNAPAVDFCISWISEQLDSVMREKIVAELPLPVTYSPDEMVNACLNHRIYPYFSRQFSDFLDDDGAFDKSKTGLDGQTGDQQHEQFINAVLAISNRRWNSGPIKTISLQDGYDFLCMRNKESELLWSRGESVQVWLTGVLPEGPVVAIPGGSPDFQEYAVYVTVVMRGSKESLFQACVEVQRVVSTVLKTLYIVRKSELDLFVFGDYFKWAEEYIASSNYGDSVSRGDEYYRYVVNFTSRLVSSYFADSKRKKNSIDRRIRNAIDLLCQADQLGHRVLSAALSVAAIEALLCCDSGSLSHQFSERIAALLELEPRWRRNCYKFAKDAYTLRSKILHGEEVECSGERPEKIRLLAAAVLIAIDGWQACKRRLEEEEDSDLIEKLFEELDAEKFGDKQLAVGEYAKVLSLWRHD